jgi:sec-independent protein translocase protein TatA
MGEFSPFHWLVVLAVVVLLFGGKKIPEVMRGIGEGIRSFKEGVRGDINNPAHPPKRLPRTRHPRHPLRRKKSSLSRA